MVTRDEYFKVICAASMFYEEALCDMDVIMPTDDSDIPKPFIDYIKAHRMKDYGWLVGAIVDPIDVWDYLDCVVEKNDDEVPAYELLADYAVYNPAFGEASYERAMHYLEYEADGADIDDLINEGYEDWISANE